SLCSLRPPEDQSRGDVVFHPAKARVHEADGFAAAGGGFEAAGHELAAPCARDRHASCPEQGLMSEGRIIGIDLGTTNCCVAVLQNGSALVIPSRQGQRTMPSVI